MPKSLFTLQLDPTDDHFNNVVKKNAFVMNEYYKNIKKPVNKKE